MYGSDKLAPMAQRLVDKSRCDSAESFTPVEAEEDLSLSTVPGLELGAVHERASERTAGPHSWRL